jgi:PAS domain S-box-containing protein
MGMEAEMSGKKKSRVNYQELFDTMTEGFSLHEIICDEDGEPYDYRFLEVNPAFEHLTGMKKEDVLGKTYRELFPNDDSSWIKACGAVSLTGEPIKLESYSPDLKKYYKVIAYRPAPGQFATIFMDISERMRIEEDLLKSEAKSRAILDSIPDLIFHLSGDGTFLDYRASGEGVLYVPPESFLGRRIDEVLPPDLVSQVKSKMEMARKSSRVQTFEYRLPIDGQQVYYEARIALSSDNTFIVLIRDINERKKMEEALREGERLFHAAIDNFPYTFIIYGRDLRIQYINRIGIEMSGMSEEEIIGHTDEELFPPNITEAYMDRLRGALETGTIQTWENTRNLESGRTTMVFNYVPIFTDKGEICRILGINYDITEIKEAKRKLELTLKENRKQNRLLKAAFEELGGNYKEVEQLLYKISHGLITPLVTIEGFLDLLKKDVEKCNRIRIEIDLGLIGDAVSRMQMLLGEALELSSLGMLPRPAESIPFKEIIDEAREHFKKTSTSNHLAITEDGKFPPVYYIGSAEGHEYPDLQVGDEVNPRPCFMLS